MTQLFAKTQIIKFTILSALLLLVLQNVDAKDQTKKETKKPITEGLAYHSENLKPVRGFVVDEFGEPMVGVKVVALGSTKSTITNTEGKYRLLAKGDDILEFSQIGTITKEEKITSSRIVNIEMVIE